MNQSWAALAPIRERVFADITLTPDALRLTAASAMHYVPSEAALLRRMGALYALCAMRHALCDFEEGVIFLWGIYQL